MLIRFFIVLLFLLGWVTTAYGQTQQPLHIVVVQHEIMLIWDASTSSGFTGYNVYRGTQPTGPFSILASVSSSTTTYTDLTTQGDTQYCYVVTTVSPNCPNTPTCGESGDSNSTCGTVPPPGATLGGGGSGSTPTVALNANALAFGNVVQNTPSSTQNVTVANTSGGVISITGITYTGTDAADFSTISTTCSGTLSNGSTCTIVVGFTPTATPSTTESATFNFAYTGFSGSPLTAALTGKSVSMGTVSVSPANSSAGNVQYQLSASGQTVTVANDSGVTITIGTVTYTGTNAADFATGTPTTCSGALATGLTCTVTPLFSPTRTPVTTETATMNIPYTGFTGSPLTVPLSGTSVTVTGGISIPLSFFGISWFNSASYPLAGGIIVGTEGKIGGIGLNTIEPTCNGGTNQASTCYNWATMDAWVASAQANGWTLVWDWDGTPGWMCGTTATRCTTLPTNLAAVTTTATTIATRYKGKIKYYETYNEMNTVTEWTDTCANAVLVTNAIYTGIKAGDPNAIVGGPNMGYGGNNACGSGSTTGTEWLWMQGFLTTRDSNGNLPQADTVGEHFYQRAIPSLPSVGPTFFTVYNAFRAVMTAAGIPTTRPLLSTEGSFGPASNSNCSAPLNATACLTAQQQIAYIGRFLVTGASVSSDGGGVLLSWYAYDLNYGTLNGTFGMNSQNASAYGAMESWLSGAKFTQQCATGTPSTVFACPFTSTALGQAEVIFNTQNGTATNIVVPSWAGHYQQLLGTKTAIVGGVVTVNDTPILLTP